jgi:hypothetical protein
MNRIVFSLIVVVITVIIGPVFAEEPETPEQSAATQKPFISFKTGDREPIFGDRFSLKAGYKVWVTNWQAQVSTGAALNQANTDHPVPMDGPTVTGTLRLRDGDKLFHALVLNFTWLQNGFDFAEQSAQSSHFFANRRDYTVTASVAIWEGFGIFGGYYNSRREWTNRPNDLTIPGVRYPSIMDGPIVGIFGSVPASEHLRLYGNFAYALFNYRGSSFSPEFVQDTKAVQGYMTEVGVTIIGPRVWRIGTELQVGFRAQVVEKHFGRNATGGSIGTDQLPLLDVTYGPIVTVSGVF